MAELAIAFALIKKVEGMVWSNSPTDLGRETYCGISRIYWPEHPIWDRVDMAKRELGNYNAETLSEYLGHDHEAQRIVKQFYAEWWDRMRLSEIKNQKVANFIFQYAINRGEKEVILILQMACVSNNRKLSDDFIDGIIGKDTISAVNAMEQKVVISALATVQQYGFFKKIQEQPDQIANKDGWSWRIKTFL